MTSMSDVAFTPAVKAWQARFGSRAGYARLEADGGWRDRVTLELRAFLAARGCYLASAAGQPYIQRRNGPPGFLGVLDERTLAFADYRGNRQYISTGNLSENARAFLFLIDYKNHQRIKIWGRAEVKDADAELEQALAQTRQSS
ncbi:MAG: pyridoxamine 5'-phosphate oxidase family protein [Gammaproteobacteria bacterium]